MAEIVLLDGQRIRATTAELSAADKKAAAAARDVTDKQERWGEFDPEFDRPPNDLTQREIYERAALLRDPATRRDVGRQRGHGQGNRKNLPRRFRDRKPLELPIVETPAFEKGRWVDE